MAPGLLRSPITCVMRVSFRPSLYNIFNITLSGWQLICLRGIIINSSHVLGYSMEDLLLILLTIGSAILFYKLIL